MSEQGPTGTGTTEGTTEGVTGTTGTTEGVTGTIEQPVPTPPPTISLSDITSAVEVVQVKEAQDKVTLESIGTLSFESLKASLIQWAVAGYPNAYKIYEISVSPPGVCSDGVTRNLADYITFCSGKTIHEHVDVLQARTVDIDVSFAYTGSSIIIVVSKSS
jgi:hypothetical protein